MALPYVTKATGSSTGFAASPLTISSVACGTAADTIVIGWIIGTSSLANSFTNMSVNGDTSATTAHTEQTWGANDNARLFYWVGTGPGTVNVAFSWTGDIAVTSAGVIVYSGASALANISADIGGSGTTSLSKTVSSATDDLALAVWLCDPFGSYTFTAGSGGTERFDETVDTMRHYVSEEAGAASVTVDGTTSGTVYRNLTYGFSITAAAGGGGGSSIAPISNYYRMMRSA